MNDWIAVTDHLPHLPVAQSGYPVPVLVHYTVEEDKEIGIVAENGVIAAHFYHGQFYYYGEYYDEDSLIDDVNIMHWMPFPLPPTA